MGGCYFLPAEQDDSYGCQENNRRQPASVLPVTIKVANGAADRHVIATPISAGYMVRAINKLRMKAATAPPTRIVTTTSGVFSSANIFSMSLRIK